jgi:hypothetical protein
MGIREDILKFMGIKGPVLPVQIAKEIGSNILIASAHLSELSSNKELKISSLKVGSSPLYYLPGQEGKLEGFVDNLPGKEKQAYNLLRQNKILRDSKVEPSIRVALRQIKDFAIPLQVNYKGSTEIFWRWFLLNNEEAEKSIKAQIKPKSEVKKHVKKEIQEELKKPKERDEIKPKKEEKKEIKQIKEKKPDTFLDEIKGYFGKNSIEILEENLLRKGAEYNFVIKLPSSVGSLSYFCVAKSKKRLNDGDLSSAFINAQSRKLPLLFLTKGGLTKRAQEMLEKEFEGMKIKQI